MGLANDFLWCRATENKPTLVSIKFGTNCSMTLFDVSNLLTACDNSFHDDVIKWKHFPRYWPFVRGTTGHRWVVSLTKASDTELLYFLWSAPEQTVEQTIEMSVTWDAIALIMTSLWWLCTSDAYVYMCVLLDWAIICSENNLSPTLHQAITLTNANPLSAGLSGTNFREKRRIKRRKSSNQ